MMAPPPPSHPQDEAHVVRFEIPPMMRYCAGTCPCTWVTAIALPNIVYFRKFQLERGEEESVLKGAARQEESQYEDFLVPAQCLMGLSSYFAWYYGYGFYGPAKYPLLLYGFTLASHSIANEGDISKDPNMVLVQRAACAVGTVLCTFCFLRISKFASLLMLPACGIYGGLAYVTWKGINDGNTTNNNAYDDVASSNINNNQEAMGPPTQSTRDPPSPSLMTQFPQYHRTQFQRKKKKRRKSILKPEDDADGRNMSQSQDRDRRPSKTNVSFNDTVGVKYHRQFSSSLSSSSLSSHENDVTKDIVK